ERDPRGEHAAEHLADLVLLTGRAEERGVRSLRGPRVRGLGLERLEPSVREQLEQLAFDGGELQAAGRGVAARPRRASAGTRGLEGAANDVRAVDPAGVGERRLVAGEDPAELVALAPVGEGLRREIGGGDAGAPELLEGALQGAVEPGPVA